MRRLQSYITSNLIMAEKNTADLNFGVTPNNRQFPSIHPVHIPAFCLSAVCQTVWGTANSQTDILIPLIQIDEN